MNPSLMHPRAPLMWQTALLALTAIALLSTFAFSSTAGAQTTSRLALVTRSIPVPEADNAYVEHLTGEGWDVTLLTDDDILDDGSDAISGYDLVVISSTVYASRIQSRLRGAPEPIIVAESQLFSAFGMVGSGDSGYTSSSKKLNIAQANHPMAAGLSGEVTVATSAKPMNFGVPGNDAYVIASAKDAASQAVIFAYEAGGTLVDGQSASGPRVGMYMTKPHVALANRDGWALFDAAAAWATTNAPVGTPEIVQTPVSTGPGDGALFGANVSTENFPKRYDAVQGLESQLGRELDIVNRYHELSAALESSFFWDRRHLEDGRTVMISWRATDNGGPNGSSDPRRASKIVAGQFDREIEAMATAMRDLEDTVMLRFAWEMDQDEGSSQLIGTPSEFIAAWRYVHRKFEQAGADNVEWVWGPRARSFNGNDGQRFYPGSEYVDWVAGSAVPINSFDDPQTIFGAWNDWAASIGKPQLLWTGLRENPDDPRWKTNFINEILALSKGQWSGIKAIVYYNNISPLGNDYTVDTSRASLNAFRNLACDANFTSVHGC